MGAVLDVVLTLELSNKMVFSELKFLSESLTKVGVSLGSSSITESDERL